MPRITISYRREDSGVITGRIFDRLVAQYGRDAIFRDIDDVPVGVDFRAHIGQVLDESDVVLAIIGPRWLGTRGGQTRLSNEADPVRVEIEAALRRDMPLVPVLVMRGAMPQASQLPDSIKEFAFRNALRVDAGQDFDVHMGRMVRALDRLLERTDSAAPIDPPAVATRPAVTETAPLAIAVAPPSPLAATPAAVGEPTDGAPRPSGALRTVTIAMLAALLGALVAAGAMRILAPGEPAAPTPPDVAAAVSARQAAEAKVRALQDELAALRAQGEQDRKRLSTETAATQDTLAASQKQADEREKQLQEAKAQLADMQKQADTREKQLRQAGAQLTDLKKQVDKQGKQRQQAEAQLADVQKQVDERGKQLQQAEAQLADLQKQLQTAEVSVAEARKQLTDRQSVDSAGAARVEALKVQVKSLGDQLAEERQAHQQALAQIDSLKAKPDAAPPAVPASSPPAAAAASPDSEQTLSLDDKRQIQNDLRTLAHLRGEADGNFGPATRSAIKEFQSFEGATESGTLSEAEHRTLHEMATRLEAILQRPAASPLGVQGATVKGAAQRYARAWNFETGKGVKANPAEAVYWYGLAAADGEAKALTNLGTLLVRGQGVAAADPAAAALLWQAAAAHGEATAMFNLGAMWEHGIGTTADLGKAKAWYQRAASHNNPEAHAAVQRLGS